VVDAVAAEHRVTVVAERVRSVPLVYAEVGVEAVRHAVPRRLPAHARLHARDVGLRRARDERESGVAGVQMGDVGDLVRHKGTTAAAVLGPAVYPGLEERAVDDELTAAFEQVEQARLALRPVELVLLF